MSKVALAVAVSALFSGSNAVYADTDFLFRDYGDYYVVGARGDYESLVNRFSISGTIFEEARGLLANGDCREFLVIFDPDSGLLYDTGASYLPGWGPGEGHSISFYDGAARPLRFPNISNENLLRVSYDCPVVVNRLVATD